MRQLNSVEGIYPFWNTVQLARPANRSEMKKRKDDDHIGPEC